MKKRIVLAIIISLLFHCIFFSIDYNQFKKCEPIIPKLKQISVTIAYKTTLKQTEKSINSKPKPIVKPAAFVKPAPPAPIKTTHIKPKQILSTKPKPKRLIKKKIVQREKRVVKAAKTDIPTTKAESEPKPKSELEPEPEPEIIRKTKSIKVPQNINLTPNNNQNIKPKQLDKKIVKSVTQARPAYKKNPLPIYPKIARHRGYNGTVLLEVLVDKSGKAVKIRLYKSSEFKILDQAALKSVKSWIFEPGTIEEQKVDMWVKVPVRFELY
jgi:periplasmic protein TonB